MSQKTIPFDRSKIEEIAAKYPTPFHIYDEAGIRTTARNLKKAFSWSKDYINYFAVKATPNPYIMEILKEEGMGADASSLPELILSDKVGLQGHQIMFTSNNTPAEEYIAAYELGAVINLDDINQIEVLEKSLGGKFPEFISFRYNPGPDLTTYDGNFIGSPEEAKFGVTTEQLPKAYELARNKGAKKFGLHTMVVSNELQEEAHIKTATMLFEMAVKLHKDLGINIEQVNFGGGLGVAYKPTDKEIDLEKISQGIKAEYERLIKNTELDPLRIVTENGRYVTGPNGYLVTKVRSLKHTYHDFIGVDASMADLMRPGMYDSYHHITILGKENQPTKPRRVVGGLCENNDIFTGVDTKDRDLPEAAVGDFMVIYDAGAHGRSMGFNYNGKLRSGELLLKTDGSVKAIRRSETIEDYFATLDYPGL